MSQENTKHFSQLLPNFGYSEAEHIPEDKYATSSSVRNVIGESTNSFASAISCSSAEMRQATKALLICGIATLKNAEVSEEPVITEDIEAEVIEEAFKCHDYEHGAIKCEKQCIACKDGDYYLEIEDKKKLLFGTWKASDHLYQVSQDSAATEA